MGCTDQQIFRVGRFHHKKAAGHQHALRLRQRVRALGLDGAVRFCGRLDRDAMAALYRSADLVLNPSLADNMPNSLLEAWASGVPVVSTDCGALRDMLTDGVEGRLVPVGDVPALATALTALVDNPQRRSEMGRRARERAEREGSIAHTVAGYQRLLTELVAR